jgi:hypothetical protein
VSTPSNQVSCPAGSPFTRDASASCNYTVTGSEFNATVNATCTGPSLTYTLSGATLGSGTSLAGVVLNKGITTVTWTLINGTNTRTCSFTVTVADITSPSLQCPAAITQAANGNNCSKSITVPNPVFSDNCGVTILSWVMSGATTGSSPLTGINYVGSKMFNVGTTSITYTAKDAANNPITCTFNVTVTNNKCSVAMLSKNTLAEPAADDFSVLAYPNPTEEYFNLAVKTRGVEMVTLIVFNEKGKLLYTAKGLPSTVFKFGNTFVNGAYVAELIQGKHHKAVKLVKQ